MTDKIKRFIECLIPVTTCNLRCHYCYITQNQLFSKELPCFEHSPETIAKALSPERMGGICMLNMCGQGETLLPPEVPLIVKKCLETGNYVTIVTNGTMTKRFETIAEMPKELLERLFFKFSLQYLEFKRLNILENFATNVNLMRQAGASITVEITPNDELIPYIDEVKDYSLKHFGALPHVSVARDMRDPKITILTKYTKEEYEKIWSTFESPMFKFKLPIFGEKRNEFCYAGDWSFFVNLNDGNMYQCYVGDIVDNLYRDLSKPLNFNAIANKCCQPHCYNAHSFLLFDDIPGFSDLTYADIRNRICTDGSEWLQPRMKNFMKSKLSETNKKYNIIKKLCLKNKGK